MTRNRTLTAMFLLMACSLFSTPVHAQEEWTPPPHVRPEHGVRSLVEEATRRSPLIRELIERLEGLDVTVYIRARTFKATGLDGRTALLATAGSRRYLVIELACERSEVVQMATLGHELYHATEIAEEPSVVSAATLAKLYERSGGRGGVARTPPASHHHETGTGNLESTKLEVRSTSSKYEFEVRSSKYNPAYFRLRTSYFRYRFGR
jgi:hypothetical protein